MGIGFSQMPVVGQRVSARQEQKQAQEQKQGLGAATEQVLSASPSVIQEFMQDLEQRGEIVQDLLPGDEEMLLGEEAVEIDAEWDFADEDATPEEDADSRTEWEYESSPFSEAAYELRVCSVNGKVFCEAPETGWEGYRGVSSLGTTALSKLTQRARAYHEIARWLESSGWLTEKAADFSAVGELTQKPFCKKHNLEESSFSRALNNAVLAWPEATIPLRSLFK